MKYDPKYDDYEMAAIAREGSKNWPSQWNGENDASFQKYKAAVDRGQKVSAAPFLAAQTRIYANMGANSPKPSVRRARRFRTRRFRRF